MIVLACILACMFACIQAVVKHAATACGGRKVGCDGWRSNTKWKVPAAVVSLTETGGASLDTAALVAACRRDILVEKFNQITSLLHASTVVMSRGGELTG